MTLTASFVEVPHHIQSTDRQILFYNWSIKATSHVFSWILRTMNFEHTWILWCSITGKVTTQTVVFKYWHPGKQSPVIRMSGQFFHLYSPMKWNGKQLCQIIFPHFKSEWCNENWLLIELLTNSTFLHCFKTYIVLTSVKPALIASRLDYHDVFCETTLQKQENFNRSRMQQHKFWLGPIQLCNSHCIPSALVTNILLDSSQIVSIDLV